MNARKSLFAAMLAAGIIAGDALPEAQSTVFVPELAMLDGALCVAGALEEQEFLSLLREVGFQQASIEPTRIYRIDDAQAFLQGTGLDADLLATQVDGRFMGAFVRARKP